MRQDGTACKTWVPPDGPESRRLYHARRLGGGWFSFSLPDTSELVILSAAGAKDLLFPQMRRTFRCEGPLDAKDLLFRAPQARTTYVAASKNSRSFARARAARALRMTTPHAVSGKRGERRVMTAACKSGGRSVPG